MTIDFSSPSYRATGTDLTISMSPLGLVELADEEFYVHGPRINRYSQLWAFYLGHHWSYRREPGEPQVTINYCRAFSDFITNFTFGRGVSFSSDKKTEHMVPEILQRVWEVDNAKDRVLWEIGNQGGVSGDVFVKVAYEEPWTDTAGRRHNGRVRILPLNSAFVFPSFHPHDKERLLLFKQKYRYWATTSEGTRTVNTYTEVISDDTIEEYVNDELALNSPRKNPLGTIPVAFAPNLMVSGSPWGLSDIQDIILLNREINEKATDLSDIVNYHAAPVTIMTGSKSDQLQRGPNKIWGGLPTDANVWNLELGGGGVEAGLQYIEFIKKAMHELMGVPEGALGDVQPISNTTGVALAIQYQSMMQRRSHKMITYGGLLRKINELVLLTIAQKRPQEFIWDPDVDEELKPYQLPYLDPADPLTYQTYVNWPPPLPTDVLATLNEIALKVQLGIMSKRQALQELGEAFPDEKLRELFLELVEDAINQGALTMLTSQIAQGVQAETGQFMPGGPQPFPPPAAGATMPGMDASGVDSAGGQPRDPGGHFIPSAGPDASGEPPTSSMTAMGPFNLSPTTKEIWKRVTERAYGTKLMTRTPPRNSEDDD